MRNSIFFFFLFSASLFGQAPTSSVDPESFTSGSISDTSKVRVYSRRDGANRKFEFWKLRLMFAPHARTSPIAYTPSASGNVSNKGELVVTVAGNPYYIDGYGAAIQTNKLINSSVTSAHIVNSTITTNDILNATILGEDIGDMDASSGQVLTWTGSTWEPQAGNATSEPSRQIVFGTGSGVDSDTSFQYNPSTQRGTHKIKVGNADKIAHRIVAFPNPASVPDTTNLIYQSYSFVDPAGALVSNDSLTLGIQMNEYKWRIENHSDYNGIDILSPSEVTMNAQGTSEVNVNGAWARMQALPSGTLLYDGEVQAHPSYTYMKMEPNGTGSGVGVVRMGIIGEDSTHAYTFDGLESVSSKADQFGLVGGYLKSAIGTIAGRGIKGSRYALSARQILGTKAFDWWSVDHYLNDTTSSFVGFYNRRYFLPNAAPSTTTTTKSRLEWTGTGSATTPAFASTLTNTATLDFPSTAAGTVSDLTVTVTGAADGDMVQIGVPNAAVSATGSYFAWVSATNTVTIRLKTEATEDPASASFKVWVIK
jgi:hypothetical protein